MRRVALALSLLLISACEGEPEPPTDGGVPTRDLWERCQVNEECMSTACVQVAPTRGVCTRSCESDGDCPTGPSWGCVSPEGASTLVCGCVSDAEEEICGDGLDNDCNGETDDCRRCGGEPVPENSRDHCGECFRACRDDQDCVDGDCECAGFGEVDCLGACVDPRSDASHCGACGNVCSAAQECRDSECVCPRGTPTLCGDTCTDTDSDMGNCGACGVECPTGTMCLAGECSCTDARAPTFCAGTGCVDTTVDERHCGDCATSCERGEECTGGTCACPVAGEQWCSGACRNLSSDASHCGSCNAACRPGERCVGGSCRCDSGVVCGGVCEPVDDLSNCGACGTVCRADQGCVGGSCRCVGTTDCAGRCVDLVRDPSNCGSCGNVCGVAMSCSSSTCRCTSALSTFCPSVGGCVDTRSDPAHCGGCNAACAGPQICRSGACGCPTASETYCPALGSCTDLATDAANCGTCGNVCPAAQVCVAGACACPASAETYCPGTGTCEDLSNDPSNCGSCGAACAATEICRFGGCGCSAANERWCGSTGVCTDIRANDLHCGGCDAACASGAICASYRCVCAVPSETLCSDGCHDLTTDVANCGSCGNACLSAQECRSGVCACPAPTIGPETVLSLPGVRALDGDVAPGGGGAAAVWVDVRGGNANVYFQRLDATGAKVGPELALTTLTAGSSNAVYPAIAWSGTEWGVAWRQYLSLGGGGSALELGFQRIDATGTPVAPPTFYDLRAPPWDAAGPDIQFLQLVHSSTLGYVVVGGRSSTNMIILGDGTAPLPAVTLGGGFTRNDVAVAPSGAVGVVYVLSSRVWFREISPTGVIGPTQLQWSWAGATTGFRWADAQILHNGTDFVIVNRESDGTDDRISACVVGSCGTRSVLSTHTPIPSSRESRVAQVGSLGMVAFHAEPTPTTRSLFGLRFDTVGLTPLEPLAPLATSTTVLDAEWSTAWVSPTTLLAAWVDTRVGTELQYAQTVSYSPCP